MSKANDGEAAFKKAYASLNAAQREAVNTIEGPVMVIAGPGTGKTQILTLRIARILYATDTQPEQILALTFTESGAKAMRERLRRYVGSLAYRIPIHTFHGFAGQLIRQYPDAFPAIIGGQPATDSTKVRLIETILKDPSFSLLRPTGNPQYYVTPILRIVSTLKQEFVTPDRLATLVSRQEAQLLDTEKFHEKGAHKGKVRGEYSTLEKVVAKNHELLAVYRQYQTLLRSEGLFDFDDMLLQTVTALQSDESMLRELQETYQYVLADEHQDVNGTQNQLLESLVSYHDFPNIFVVGDEKQAIYRFQGASLENFLYFEDKFPGTKTISLTENYRSGQAILDVAHSLIATDDERLRDLRVPLIAATTTGANVEMRTFSHQAIEDSALVQQIKAEISAGTAPEEIAIIVRTNREVEAFATALRKVGIAVRPSADSDILTHPITNTILQLLTAVVQSEDESALAVVLHHSGWGVSPADLLRLLSSRSYERPLSALITDSDLLESANIQNIESIVTVGSVLAEARALNQCEAPQRVLEYLLTKSGLLDYTMTYGPHEAGRIIRRLYDEIEAMVVSEGVTTLAGVREALQNRHDYGLPLNAPFISTNHQAVAVMTAHKSKGLEFESVYLPHLTDALWGGAKRRTLFTIPLTKPILDDDFARHDDERRLLYVGMTRAKQRLALSTSAEDSSGKVLEGSRLLEDIDTDMLSLVSTDLDAKKFSPLEALHKGVDSPALETELLKALFLERGFSATSINNYIRSPWDYFYRNLLRLPEVQAPAMQYGTAIHNVLEQVTRQRTQSGQLPNMSDIRVWLKRELGKLPITTEEFTRLHERGLTALSVYTTHLDHTASAKSREELSISVMMPTGLDAAPEIKLTGKLDRIDLDETGNAVRVVDYKTGKARSRNAIEGKTKNDDGSYKRQLVFYALLLELYDDEQFKTREGVLSFVEPDSKGVIKEETFVITDEEIAALRQEIIVASEALVTGTFLTVPCNPEQSSYCHLVELLRRDQS